MVWKLETKTKRYAVYQNSSSASHGHLKHLDTSMLEFEEKDQNLSVTLQFNKFLLMRPIICWNTVYTQDPPMWAKRDEAGPWWGSCSEWWRFLVPLKCFEWIADSFEREWTFSQFAPRSSKFLFLGFRKEAKTTFSCFGPTEPQSRFFWNCSARNIGPEFSGRNNSEVGSQLGRWAESLPNCSEWFESQI